MPTSNTHYRGSSYPKRPAMPSKTRVLPIAVAVAVAALAIFAYWPALQGGFIWDDDEYVTHNETLHSPNGLYQIWFEPGATPQYYPLVFSSFWVEYHLWRLNPVGYHIVNLVLHLCAAFLLWRLTLLLGIPGGWLAAILFALHPVQVESVAWISERKNVLSVVLYLAAAYFLIFRFDLTVKKTPHHKPLAVYAMAMVLFLAALLSKSVTLSLPAAVLLLIWWRRGHIKWREAALLSPFFCLGGMAGSATVWMERHVVGAQGQSWSFDWIERCLIAGRAVVFYLWKLFWPAELIFNYPRWEIRSNIELHYLFPLSVVLIIVVLWAMRHRWGRGPLGGFLFFVGTLFPALGFIDVYPFRYAYVADHFQYHASIGIFVTVAAGFVYFFRRFPTFPPYVFWGLLVIGLPAVTFHQSKDYTNLETLWRHTLDKNHDSALAHNNLGVMLFERGAHSEAIAHYRAAVRSDPENSEAWNNLLSAFIQMGQAQEAVNFGLNALLVDPENANVHYNLGIAHAQMSQTDQAIHHYRESIRLNPSLEQAYFNLGLLLKNSGLVREAVYYFNRLITLNPQHARAQAELGVALGRLGEYPAAEAALQRAIQMTPEAAEGHSHLGMTYFIQGKLSEALAEFEHAIALDSGQPEYHGQLADTLASTGECQRALAEYRKTLDLDSSNSHARVNCGVMLARTGQLSEAIHEFTAAIKQSPDFIEAYRNMAQAQWLNGEVDTARNTFRTLQQKSPEQAEILLTFLPDIAVGGDRGTKEPISP